MVDKALLLRKLAELEEYLKQMRDYANITIEQYSSDWRIHHILSSHKDTKPQSRINIKLNNVLRIKGT